MLKDLKIEEFVKRLASSEPVPGGGAVAALCSSLGCALAAMVARLTDGKKGYEEEQATVSEMVRRYDGIADEFLVLMEEDVEAFNKVMAAFGMPKSDDEEKKRRTAAIQDALRGAAEVPMKVAEKSASLFEVFAYLVQKGNRNAQSDALVGAMMARSAVLGALFNVKINLDSIKDASYVQEMREKVDALELLAVTKEREIVFGGSSCTK